MTTQNIQIYLNSKTADKYVDGQTGNCYFHMPYIHVPESKKIHISVLIAQIPASFYNINHSNNTLVYSVNDSAPITENIEVSNYNITTLMSYLISILSGFSITYNNMSNKITIQHSTFEFTIYKSSTCLELLGLSNKDHISNVRKIISDNVVNLFTTRMMYICSDNFILNNIDSNSANISNILQSIPITSAFNSIIHFTNSHDIPSEIYTTRNFTNLHIMITNQDNVVFEFNNVHWSITLLLSIK